MTTLTIRSVKGSPLTNNEVDDNFTSLNTDKLEKSNNLSELTDPAAARTNLNVLSPAQVEEQAIAFAIALG